MDSETKDLFFHADTSESWNGFIPADMQLGIMDHAFGMTHLLHSMNPGDPIADGGENLLDRVLDGLARPRSRRVLYCLVEKQPHKIDELAAEVAELEAVTQPTTKQCENVKIDLYHNVLPRLADHKLIEYDARSKTVCFSDPPSELDDFLRLCRKFDAEN